MAAQLVLTARAGRWQSGVTLAGGDYRCLRCAEPVAPSVRMLPEADSRFVCFACVDELRRGETADGTGCLPGSGWWRSSNDTAAG